jgi:hypothetical protein
MNFLDFLKSRNDPLCRARIRFFEFVSKSYCLDYLKLLEIVERYGDQFVLERIAVWELVSLT